MRVGPLKLKLQLFCGEALAMGPGKADLLEAIERERSIAGAGRTLGMSYRRAWMLVDEMNRCFEVKLVETLTGGGRERGARVTPTGQIVLDAYRTLEAATAATADTTAYDTLTNMLRRQPLPPKKQPIRP
jgi:molybdate transport system regulatory protein